MKTTVTADLTRDYLQRLERQNYLATMILVVIVTISIFWCLFHIGNSTVLELFSNLMYPLSSAIGALWVGMTAYRARRGPLRLAPHHQLAWLLIGLGLLANCLGAVYYAYLEHADFTHPVPSFSDIGYTLFYPLTFAGLLIMPNALRFRVRTALDALITTLCIFGIMWFFFISTIFKAHSGWINAITVSYPVWDMLLIFAIVLLIRRRTEAILHISLIVFALGIVCQIWSNIGYAYTLAIGTYYTGLFYIDPFWYLGCLLFGLSALYQYFTIARRAYNKQTHLFSAPPRIETTFFRRSKKSQHYHVLIQSLLIYAPLLLLLTTLLGNQYFKDANGRQQSIVLIIITAIVGVLVTVRYIIAARENEILLQEREQHRLEAERLRVLATELTNILELDRLFERIVTSATSQFGFDAAILILLEEYTLSLDEQSRLLLVAAASTSPAATSWLFQGAHISKCDLLTEKESHVIWSEQHMDLPPELDTWRHEHNIRSTLFVPLVYQEQFLGTLCFGSITEEHFSEHDTRFARTYAEQIAPIIKHTRLYQTMREQETFAKAMANIATRLNSAVVDPADIHELICAEAARALRADYVLLYGIGDNEHLFPLATFSSMQESPSPLNDWPTIAVYEHEGQVLNSMQPVLLQFQSERTILRRQSNILPGTYSWHSDTGPLQAHTLTRAKNNRSGSLSQEKLERKHMHTAILAPLIAGGDPIGLLVLGRSPAPNRHDQISFVNSDLSYVQDFAEQAAVALTNAQLYQRLRTAHQRQQELDQLKDQFMITASHELRTPLTAVQGYIELIAQYDESMPKEQRQEFLQKARRSCDELVVLLHNVMDASHLEIEANTRSTHNERVLIKDMVDSVINLIEPRLTHEQREVHLSIPLHLAVRGDSARLRQVLLNLSVNALKYSPPRTPIIFSARAILDNEGYALISVTDRGKGITQQDQTRLFERFVRLESDINSPVRGSGLGLYISRCLVEAMDGKIWIESNGIPGEGSTFHVQLPLA
ncbi:MAG TPA: ATP-binding protein [Ktedonobacteraceae bacterium]|nr:ATP-binding protein [Ktedonobacteraceae bacterium]